MTFYMNSRIEQMFVHFSYCGVTCLCEYFVTAYRYLIPKQGMPACFVYRVSI